MARKRRKVPIELRGETARKGQANSLKPGKEVKIPLAANPVARSKPGMI